MRRSLQLSYINPPLNVAEVSLEALISFHLCFVLIFISLVCAEFSSFQ